VLSKPPMIRGIIPTDGSPGRVDMSVGDQLRQRAAMGGERERAELAAFDPMLSSRPALIVLNKLDLVGAERAQETAQAMARLATEQGIGSVLVISAEQRVGLEPLIAAIERLLGLGGIEAQCPR